LSTIGLTPQPYPNKVVFSNFVSDFDPTRPLARSCFFQFRAKGHSIAAWYLPHQEQPRRVATQD
jgi:hypothetical protein